MMGGQHDYNECAVSCMTGYSTSLYEERVLVSEGNHCEVVMIHCTYRDPRPQEKKELVITEILKFGF